MNLFRDSSRYGEVDNYNTLVKPRLEQQRNNQQTQWDLNSLRSQSNMQGMQLRDLNRRTDARQGATGRSSYKNYLDYYPGLKR